MASDAQAISQDFVCTSGKLGQATSPTRLERPPKRSWIASSRSWHRIRQKSASEDTEGGRAPSTRDL